MITLPNGAIRNLQNPLAHNHPDNYDSYTSSMDSHVGCGVVNKAHYLMIEGVDPPGFLGVTVQALGRAKTQQIVYKTLMAYLTSSATFYDYALATIAACSELRITGQHGLTISDCTAVYDAWVAVRVLPQQFPTVNCGLPGNFSSIQDAINAAVDGQTVGICAGTYHEHLVIADKDINLFAMEGAHTAVVDGSNTGRVLDVLQSNVEIFGLVIRNGAVPAGEQGAGISAFGNGTQNLRLEQVRVEQNSGGGVIVHRTGLQAYYSSVQDNTASPGIRGNSTDIDLFDSDISFNSGAGGIVLNVGHVLLDNSTVTNNQSSQGGGGVLLLDSVMDVVSGEVHSNFSASQGGGVNIAPGSFTGHAPYVLQSLNSYWGTGTQDNQPEDIWVYGWTCNIDNQDIVLDPQNPVCP